MSLPELGAQRARSILVVEDEPSIRMALRRYFTRAGWEVTEAEDGLAAFAMLDGRAGWDVVLCDLGLPMMTGGELYECLALVSPQLVDRLILTSGDVTAPEVADFLAGVRCRVVEKPFTLSAIAAAAGAVAAAATPALAA